MTTHDHDHQTETPDPTAYRLPTPAELRAIREAIGVSQHDLAGVVPHSPQTICAMEGKNRNRTANPHLSTLRAHVEALRALAAAEDTPFEDWPHPDEFRLPTPEDLQRLREAAGLSRYALANEAAISRQGLARLEGGQTDPEQETVEAILDAVAGAMDTEMTEETNE